MYTWQDPCQAHQEQNKDLHIFMCIFYARRIKDMSHPMNLSPCHRTPHRRNHPCHFLTKKKFSILFSLFFFSFFLFSFFFFSFLYFSFFFLSSFLLYKIYYKLSIRSSTDFGACKYPFSCIFCSRAGNHLCC